jgi:amino acid transporter
MTAQANGTESPAVFLRNASGLVKSAGPFDVFTYNLGLISVGIAITLVHYWVPSNYPGANIPVSEVIAASAMACIAFCFWAWSVAIPRSGGIYAFVSRGINPAIGFAVSFVDTFTWLFYNALAATFLTSIGLAPAFFVTGITTHNEKLIEIAFRLQTPIAQFLVGSGGVLVAGAILIRGMKAFFSVQRLLFVTALLGIVATVLSLARTHPQESQAVFIKAMTPYVTGGAGVFAMHQEPWVMSWRMTLLASVWPILSFVGSIFSVNIGGEIRNVRKSQALGIFGSIVISAALMIIVSMQFETAYGKTFEALLGTLGSRSVLPMPPYFSLLAGLAARNLALSILIFIGFFCWAFFWIPATLVYAARAVLAWSFDRVAPAALGYVHPRWHTPVSAILLVVVVNVAFLGLFLFFPYFATLVLVLAAMLAWIPTMAGAIAFPYLRRKLFNECPLAGKKLLGLPLMSVAGAVGLLGTIVLTVMLWNDPIAAGHGAHSLITIAVVFILGLGWYAGTRAVRRRQGIDIDRAFKEIPIE